MDENQEVMECDPTGIDISLIEQFSVILKVVSSGRKINVNNFNVLLKDTKKKYLDLYGWYYMPPTIHKLLIHGVDIISSFDLPIGQLSEEALEARQKEARKYRLGHSRKNSRVNNNQDLKTALLLTSDPHISSKRKITSKKHRDIIDEELEDFFIPEEINPEELFMEDDDSYSTNDE